MSDTYIFEQFINLIHTEIRRINSFGEIVENYGHTPPDYDPFQSDHTELYLQRENKTE
jgi:hypothetical protein